MINTDQLLNDMKNELHDGGVFSDDQIVKLNYFIERLDDYIDAKLENCTVLEGFDI